LALNAPLAKAYYMKDELRQLWGLPDKKSAERFLAGWVVRAEASGIGEEVRAHARRPPHGCFSVV